MLSYFAKPSYDVTEKFDIGDEIIYLQSFELLSSSSSVATPTTQLLPSKVSYSPVAPTPHEKQISGLELSQVRQPSAHYTHLNWSELLSANGTEP